MSKKLKPKIKEVVFVNNTGGLSTFEELLSQAGIPDDALLIAETSKHTISIMNLDHIQMLEEKGKAFDFSSVNGKLKEINAELEAILASIINGECGVK